MYIFVYIIIIDIYWLSWLSFRQWSGGAGFNPWSCHTKDSTNGT